MTIQEYKIRFLIIHPSLDFTEAKDTLSKIPGLLPGRLMNMGAERFTPRGDKLEGRYRDSRWGFSFTDEWQSGEIEELHDTLNEIADKLYAHKEYLLGLKEKGCDMQCIVSVYVEENMGETIPSDLLLKFANLGMGLGFDLYPPDNQHYAERIKEGDDIPISSKEAFEAMKLFIKNHAKEGVIEDIKSKEWGECIEEVIKSRDDGYEPWVWHIKKKDG